MAYENHIPDEELAKHVRELEELVEWMGVYIGLLVIETGDLMGLAISHGFTGWPKHQIVGDKMRAELSVDETWTDQFVEAAKAELEKA